MRRGKHGFDLGPLLAGDGHSAEPPKGFAIFRREIDRGAARIIGNRKFQFAAQRKVRPPKWFQNQHLAGGLNRRGSTHAKGAGPERTPHCRPLRSTNRPRGRDETDLLEWTLTELSNRAAHTPPRCRYCVARLLHLPAANCSSDWSRHADRYGTGRTPQSDLYRY